ncbi:putative transcriptional regulatory protein Teth514_1449 isoform X2 [Oratosquilla oratoria]|uniref:putative transcriptional regulatory protein Teth514_1449 isoform X2 n=1 Tax=Oratosquilla oratoria TaxID=337810 RepID=UPI003F76ABBD
MLIYKISMLQNCTAVISRTAASSCLLSSQNASLTPVIKRTMAGHSKWANIRHTKAAKDMERQKVFSKMTRLIKLAIKEGGGTDPKLNSSLARAIEQARGSNMPNTSIQNALKSAQKGQDNAQSYRMEYRGPAGSFFLVDILSDNLRRTKIELSTTLKKLMVEEVQGSAGHLFEEKGVIITNKSKSIEEAMDHAIDIGVEDVTLEDEGLKFLCAPEEFVKVKQSLEALDYATEYASVDFLPVQPVSVPDTYMEEIDKIVKRIEDNDDVIKVHLNIE